MTGGIPTYRDRRGAGRTRRTCRCLRPPGRGRGTGGARGAGAALHFFAASQQERLRLLAKKSRGRDPLEAPLSHDSCVSSFELGAEDETHRL